MCCYWGDSLYFIYIYPTLHVGAPHTRPGLSCPRKLSDAVLGHIPILYYNILCTAFRDNFTGFCFAGEI